jgi:serine/threonine-protein kinase RsbW
MDQPVDRPDQHPVVATMAVHGADGVAPARRLLADTAVTVGLPADRIERFTVALSEIVTNAIRHGNGSATMTITSNGSTLTVNVRDHGPGLKAQSSRALPPATQVSGRGLWLAEQLCDQVHIDSSNHGTIVQLTMRL